MPTSPLRLMKGNRRIFIGAYPFGGVFDWRPGVNKLRLYLFSPGNDDGEKLEEYGLQFSKYDASQVNYADLRRGCVQTGGVRRP